MNLGFVGNSKKIIFTKLKLTKNEKKYTFINFLHHWNAFFCAKWSKN